MVGLPEFKGLRERLVQQELLEILARLENRERLERRGLLEKLVLQELRENTAQQAQQVK
jgi:hypothetical protein